MNRLLIFFVVICFSPAAAQVNLSFKNKSYKGDTIVVKTVKDYITGLDTTLASGVVDSEGNFSCTFPLEKTSKIIIPLYFFKGILYTEPGKNYVLNMPHKTPVPVHAEVSPFFEPMTFFAFLPEKKTNELNNLIFEFDSIYEDYVTKYSSVLLFESYSSKVDTFINSIKDKYKDIENTYFKTYLSSRIAMLNYFTKKRELYYVINYYLNAMPVSVENDAYMDLFNNLFRDFFRLYSLRQEGAGLYDDVAKAKSPHAIRHTLSLNPVFINDTITELIILKGLHDSFFPGDDNLKREFPHTQLYITLDSVRLINRYNFTRLISNNIFYKVRNRCKVMAYDNLTVLDCNNTSVKLSSLKAKYAYLAFYDTRNYTCQKELKLFSKMAAKHQKDVQFVLIIVNPYLDDFKEFCKTQNFTFPVYYASPNSGIIDRFDLKAYPHYMFFDPYGFAILSAAPAPSENFEPQMYKLLE